MPNPYQCAILYHNYYSHEGIEDIKTRIKKLPETNTLLLCSVPEKLFLEKPLYNSENEKFLVTTNLGKDIGGKLLLMDLIIKLYSDIPYLIFLHDKKSYQKYSGSFEREKLFEIIEPEKFSKAINMFDADSSVGIIAQKDAIKNEYNSGNKTFETTNNALLWKLKTQYELEPGHYEFVAGTMFWVRTAVFLDFFKKHNPVQIRSTLEQGNVLDAESGTITHAWERILSWIATSAGYKIAGI